MKHDTSDPLPREWLPDPVGPASGGDPALWDRRLRELTSAAEPALAELARERPREAAGAARPRWWSLLAARWRPALAAAALTAAVVAVAIRVLPGTPSAAARAGAFSLTAVAGRGTAAALWQGMGSQADPTLAQIVLQEGSR